MKDLMIHVERIVRPVRARQSRKLRMRRELLAHLQAALEQERAHSADDASALEQARQRLGEPAELTRELQRSVPLIERVLLARTPENWNGWEKRAGKRLGWYEPATLAHWLVLCGTGAVAVMIICLFAPHIPPEARTRFFVDGIDHPAHARTVLAVVWVVQVFWFYIGMRFLTAAAAPAGVFRLPRVIRRGTLVVAAQGLLMVLIITQIVRRSPTVAEMARTLGISLLLLGVTMFVGRGVAALRRPYDEWLTLDLTQ